MQFTGHISDQGTLNIINRDEMKQWIKDNAGKSVVLTIEKQKKKRSNDQNEYYWGCVIPMVQRAMNDYGNEYSKEETHEFLKKEFNWTEIEMNGNYVKVPQSTTKLSTVDFMGYLDRIYVFASEVLGITIPAPNEQLSITLIDPHLKCIVKDKV